MFDHAIRNILCWTCTALVSSVAGQSISFDILKGKDVIGNIRADRIVKGESILYSMVSNSAFNILWKNTVQSTTITHYLSGSMYSCGAFMRINDSMRDSSNLSRIEGQANCYVHPNKRFIHSGEVTWTTARMYYEEPVGQPRIFVESEMAFCTLENTGNNTYRLLLSEGKVNHYTYASGLLKEVKVIRSMFDLFFRRA